MILIRSNLGYDTMGKKRLNPESLFIEGPEPYAPASPVAADAPADLTGMTRRMMDFNPCPDQIHHWKVGVLFVIGSLEIGGAERQLQSLVDRLHHTHRCHVYSLQSGGPLKPWLDGLGVPVFSGGLQKGDVSRAPWKLIMAEWRLLKVIHDIHPSVIHSFLPLITFMGALSGRLARVPLVITSRRALGTHQERYPVLRPLDRLASRLSHRITVNSQAVCRDMVVRDKTDPSRLVLIYNGVDSAPFEKAHPLRESARRDLGIQADAKIIITIANLIPYKGHLDLITAAVQVIRRFPDAVFLLVGEDRGIQKELEQKVASLGIGQSIRFLGRRNDIAGLLAASDISVLPSYEEGFSNVILESMSAGLPVVATDVGGNREAVMDGVTGWLVPPRNPAAMSDRILDLLGDREKAATWGRRGQHRVKKDFTIDRMVEAHLRLYRPGASILRNLL